MNQPNEPQPKKVEQKELDHSYEVLETGEVKVTQKQTLEFTWDAREFLSLYRDNEKALEKTKESYSDDHIKKMKEQEEKIKKEMEIMKPVVEKSEKLAKENYEKTLVEGLAEQMKSALKDKDLKEGWWMQVWHRQKQERKDKILEMLDSEEMSKYAKVQQKLKRKGLIK